MGGRRENQQKFRVESGRRLKTHSTHVKTRVVCSYMDTRLANLGASHTLTNTPSILLTLSLSYTNATHTHTNIHTLGDRNLAGSTGRSLLKTDTKGFHGETLTHGQVGVLPQPVTNTAN